MPTLCILINYKIKMKIILTFCLLFNLSFAYSQSDENAYNKLNSLYNKKQYFKLKNILKNGNNNLDKMQKEYFNSLVLSVFNKPSESNSYIDELLNEYTEELSDSMKLNLLNSKLLNCINLYQYREALNVTEKLLTEYKPIMKQDETDELINSALIWKAASDLSPQTVTKSGDTRLAIKKDLAGLTNIKVNVNSVEEEFIFDTGANFSTVSNSIALKTGMNFLEGSVEVGTATGLKVNAKLAYADTMKIGNIIFTNVLFLVLPDEDLSFADGAYVINGIVGFPVIEDMKQITLSDKEIFIPAETDRSVYNNLSMNGLIPIIETIVNSDTLIFSFDTGARTTMLYSLYYEENRSDVENNYQPEDIKFGGAGGEVIMKGYRLNGLKFAVASGNVSLDSISLIGEHFTDNDEFVYGNLGNDFIKKFDKMTINFENMYVDFDN